MKENQAQPLNPGDEAKPGTPGTGEDICPESTARARARAASPVATAAAPPRSFAELGALSRIFLNGLAGAAASAAAAALFSRVENATRRDR